MRTLRLLWRWWMTGFWPTPGMPGWESKVLKLNPNAQQAPCGPAIQSIRDSIARAERKRQATDEEPFGIPLDPAIRFPDELLP